MASLGCSITQEPPSTSECDWNSLLLRTQGTSPLLLVHMACGLGHVDRSLSLSQDACSWNWPPCWREAQATQRAPARAQATAGSRHQLPGE